MAGAAPVLHGLEAAGRDRDARLELLRYQVTRNSRPSRLRHKSFRSSWPSSAGTRTADGCRGALAGDRRLIDEADRPTPNLAVSRAQAILRGLAALDASSNPPSDCSRRPRSRFAKPQGHYDTTSIRWMSTPRGTKWVERRVATIEELARKHRAARCSVPCPARAR